MPNVKARSFMLRWAGGYRQMYASNREFVRAEARDLADRLGCVVRCYEKGFKLAFYSVGEAPAQEPIGSNFLAKVR